jgi:hypothetical protein
MLENCDKIPIYEAGFSFADGRYRADLSSNERPASVEYGIRFLLCLREPG